MMKKCSILLALITALLIVFTSSAFAQETSMEDAELQALIDLLLAEDDTLSLIDIEAYIAAHAELKDADLREVLAHYLTVGAYEENNEIIIAFVEMHTVKENEPVATAKPQAVAHAQVASAVSSESTTAVAETPILTVAPTAMPISTVAPTSAPVPTVVPTNTPAPTAAPTECPACNPAPTPVTDGQHKTEIYDSDNETLIRVEYYDSSNKLTQYSDVTNYDASTKSYTETVYHYDWDTDTEVLDRTDTYVNGTLTDGNN